MLAASPCAPAAGAEPPWQRKRVPAVITTRLLLDGIDDAARAIIAESSGDAAVGAAGLRACELRALRAATELTLSFKSVWVSRRRAPGLGAPRAAHRRARAAPLNSFILFAQASCRRTACAR